MRAFAIVGSPREAGNSELAARRCLDRLANMGFQTELAGVSEKQLQGCTDCQLCKEGEQCSIDDDFWPFYEGLIDADVVVLSAPTYFSYVPPELKAIMDRAGYIARANGNRFARKVGAPIAVARRAGHNSVIAQLLMWFNVSGFVVPGSTYWPVLLGRAPGEAMQDPEGVSTIDTLAEEIAWLTEKLLD